MRYLYTIALGLWSLQLGMHDVYGQDSSDLDDLANSLSSDLDSLQGFKRSPSALQNQPLVKKIPKGEYHMQPVRVIHSRVQKDAPKLVSGELVSAYGGYEAGMDSVNTASVEGSLMYVQAEAINVNSRPRQDRCKRKNDVQFIVFYEIMFAQTNETLAQFKTSDNPEYGPMVPMDLGRCSPVDAEGSLPNACYQFSGLKHQPNLGPFIGGEDKSLDIRAPYPNNYWFSFPGKCPTKQWGEKDAKCIANSRASLCPEGKNPNGLDCTFSYRILGYVPIDDVVGITSIVDESGSPYKSFKDWCTANSSHVEFIGDSALGTMESGLKFWESPHEEKENAARTERMLEVYEDLLQNRNSSQIPPATISSFLPLPNPVELAQSNPPCYKSVQECGSGFGCQRKGYSQICTPCTASENCPLGDGTFKFPRLAKAKTILSADAIKPDGKNTNVNINIPDLSSSEASNVGIFMSLIAFTLGIYIL